MTVVIGFVHGFAFSLALREALQLDGPHIAVSLAAFNLGIEAGQVILAALAWSVMRYVGDQGGRWHTGLERAISGSCMAVAAVWMVDRTQMLIAVAL